MAEFVQQSIEEMVGELHEMRATNLFDASELRGILKKRKAFEYKLRRKTKEKKDYLHYVQYEMNVLELIKKRRKESKCTIKVKNIEVPIIKRIHKLFELVCLRFKDDLKLYLAHIEFCTSRHEKKLTSRIFTNILKIHPHKPDLWIMAAKHEIESRESMSNARALLQQAIRVNQTSQKLWIEYFRMELLNAEVLHHKLAGIESEITEVNEVDSVVLSGGIAQIVYKNACNEFTDDVKLRIKFLSVSQLFDFTEALQDVIYADLQTNFSLDARASAAVAQRPLRTHHKKTEGVNSLEKQFSQCFQLFNEAVARIPTVSMWSLYVETCLNLVEKETSSTQLVGQLVAHTMRVFQEAVDAENLTEKMAVQWVSFLLNVGKVEEAMKVLKCVTDVDKFPTSVALWMHRVQVSICSYSDVQTVLKTLNEALTSCSNCEESGDLLSLWTTSIEWSVMNSPAQCTVDLLERGLNSSDSAVVLYVKNVYIEITAARDGVRAVRRLYRRLSAVEPHSVELLRKYIVLELNQVKPKLKTIRRTYDEALLAYGSSNVDLWIDYIRLELTHNPQAVGHLHWRAVKDLDSSLVDEFTQRFGLLSSSSATSC